MSDRDQRLARQVRYGFRNAQPLDGLVQAFMSSEDAQRMRRFQRVIGALRTVIDERKLARLRPVAIKAGLLTIEVDDSVLLSELRAHAAHAIGAALAEAGTGVSRIAWRLARTGPPGR